MAFYRIALSTQHFAIWDRRCWHQQAGIFFLIFSQKIGINILGGQLRKSNTEKYNVIQVKLFTSRKDTVHNLVYSSAHQPMQ